MMKISTLYAEALKASELETDRRFRQWVKWIDKVDTNQSNGYAFVGDFVKEGTVEYEIGKPRLLLVQSTVGSMKYHTGQYQVIQMNPDGTLEKVDIYTTDKTTGWALRIRDRVADSLNSLDLIEPPSPLASVSDEDLIMELTKRGYQVTKQ